MWLDSRLVVFTIAAALLVAPITGCDTAKIRVRLPGFATGSIDGIWLWQKQDTGAYKRACRFALSNPYVSGGREVVDYQQSCLDGRTSAPWQAAVTRLATNRNTVELELIFQRAVGAPKAHRASAYSAAGESALSQGSILL